LLLLLLLMVVVWLLVEGGDASGKVSMLGLSARVGLDFGFCLGCGVNEAGCRFGVAARGLGRCSNTGKPAP
jgi:hypothetical protein